MKKTLTGTLALLAGAYAVHSQGLVSMANYGVLAPYIFVSFNGTALGGANTGGGVGPTGYQTAASMANGTLWTVQLWGAPGANDPASSLTPAGGSSTFTLADGVSDGVAGTWYTSGTATIGSGNLGNTTATIELVAWYSGSGIGSYAAAVGVVPTGTSALANYTLGGQPASGPPVIPGDLPSAALGNIALSIPEPSTIALGVIGASAFLMRLRRKN